MAYAQCAVGAQTRGRRNGLSGSLVAVRLLNEATDACWCSRKNHQAQRRTWVVVDENEGGVNRSDGRKFFQEIGCSRKVAITGARKLDMLVCRHSWEKCRGVWVCWEPR